ncbi:MAG: HIT family protein [Azonexus sp.]
MRADASNCPLCHDCGGVPLLETPQYRIVRVADSEFTGFCRVIWQAHVVEMSDLATAERNTLMAVVFAVENALRACYQPDKINIASFGNVVAHLHWHIICRWRDDPWFPEPIWGTRQRPGNTPPVAVADEVLAARIAHYLGSGAHA